MFASLELKNHRGFPQFRIEKLGRINLLVGENNSGKTSILEALQLLTSVGWTETLESILTERAARVFDLTQGSKHGFGSIQVEPAYNYHELAHGYEFRPGTRIEIVGESSAPGGTPTELTLSVEPARHKQTYSQFRTSDGVTTTRLLEVHNALRMCWIQGNRREDWELPIHPKEIILPQRRVSFEPTEKQPTDPRMPTRLVRSRGLPVSEVNRILSDVALTDSEQVLIEAVQNIDDTIEEIRIVPLATSSGPLPVKENVVVRKRGVSKRLSIGVFGEGVWRLLCLAAALVERRNEVVLIDEIDAGFHHSILNRLWGLVDHLAETNNLQIFATTHSRDCYESLTSIIDLEHAEKVSIQRIEPLKRVAVNYSADQIQAAADYMIEVR